MILSVPGTVSQQRIQLSDSNDIEIERVIAVEQAGTARSGI